MTTPEGQLFDLGYQRYDGPREGRARARKALFVNGVRTCFGLGRGALAKIMPILFFGAVMAPAIVFIVIAATTERMIGVALDIPGHADYYQIVSLVLLLFSAVMAPELLCPDRRSGVITLYLVRSLTFADYVLGRWIAFFVVSLLFIYTGQVTLMVGLALSATEPLQYLRDNWADIPRFLSAGTGDSHIDDHASAGGGRFHLPPRVRFRVRHRILAHNRRRRRNPGRRRSARRREDIQRGRRRARERLPAGRHRLRPAGRAHRH